MSNIDGWSFPVGKIFQAVDDGKFYWYDEAYHLWGPYDDIVEAEEALRSYDENVLGP